MTEFFGISSIHGDDLKTTPSYWEEAKAHLRKSDSIIAELIDQYEEPPLHSKGELFETCLLYTSPSPRDQRGSRMPSSA